jgi:hypothetical protein
VNEPPRLVAEEACSGVDLRATPLPVPPRPPADPYRLSTAAAMFAQRDGAMQPATLLCDLPDRIIALAAVQGVESGKRKVGGTAWSLPRTATAPSVPPVAIEPSSDGCKQGAPFCGWKTGSPAMPSIDTIPNQRVATSGWVHGADDMCRALPDDTIATCSTATRMAYVEVGCNPTDTAPVQLQLGIHDASLERRYDLDIEVPVARLSGVAETASGTTYDYRFTGSGDLKGAFKTARLAIDLATTTATLEIDGTREPCLAFGIYRR